MYLSDINPELNSEINNIICESRQAKTLQERINELMRAWDLILLYVAYKIANIFCLP